MQNFLVLPMSVSLAANKNIFTYFLVPATVVDASNNTGFILNANDNKMRSMAQAKQQIYLYP